MITIEIIQLFFQIIIIASLITACLVWNFRNRTNRLFPMRQGKFGKVGGLIAAVGFALMLLELINIDSHDLGGLLLSLGIALLFIDLAIHHFISGKASKRAE